jgi:hypothetical protein
MNRSRINFFFILLGLRVYILQEKSVAKWMWSGWRWSERNTPVTLLCAPQSSSQGGDQPRMGERPQVRAPLPPSRAALATSLTKLATHSSHDHKQACLHKERAKGDHAEDQGDAERREKRGDDEEEGGEGIEAKGSLPCGSSSLFTSPVE